MTASETSARGRRLELYVRSLAPHGSTAQLDVILDRLDRLEATERIAGYSVHVWGRQVRPATDDRSAVGGDITDRLAAFREWAEREGMSLTSFFETKDVEVSVTNEQYTVTVLPVMALAEYDGDDLAFVAPCTDGETVYAVHDRLDALEAGEPSPEGGADTGRPRTRTGGVPNA